MAYDLALADRTRRAVAERAGVTEQAMFGGLAFLLDGKTFCGIVKQDLMVGSDRTDTRNRSGCSMSARWTSRVGR